MIRRTINRFLPLVFFMAFVMAPLMAAGGLGSYTGYMMGFGDCVEAQPFAEETRYATEWASFPLAGNYDPSMGMSVPSAEVVEEPKDAAGAATLIGEGIQFIREGGAKRDVGIGLLLMGMVFLLRLAAPTLVPKDWLAETILGATALAGFASALASGAPLLDSALTFLVLGAAAIGFWQGFAKRLYKRWKGDVEDPRPVLKP